MSTTETPAVATGRDTEAVTDTAELQGAVDLADAGVNRRSGKIKWVKLRVLVRMPLQLTCVIFLVAMVLIAIFVSPLVQGLADTQDLSLRLLPPFSGEHGFWYILGSDSLGRSELAQIIFGARSSFLVAGLVVLFSCVIGTILGLVSGFLGGWVDAAVMRIADVVVAVPTLLLAVAVLFVLQPSMINLVLVLTISRLPAYMRTARGQTLQIREQVFIEASRSLGATRSRIIAFDVAPLVVPPIMTVAMLDIAGVILAASGLSFLGLGLHRPDVDWGMLVADGRGYLGKGWWMTVFPGLAIALTSLASNFLSNWLRAMDDPGQSGRLISKLFKKPIDTSKKTLKAAIDANTKEVAA